MNNGEVDLAFNDLGADAHLNKTLGSRDQALHEAVELEAVFDVPVRVQAVLGKSMMEVNQLLKLSTGSVIELDRRVGEAIDIFVNNRLVARGEVVIVDEHLGVTMTEIVKQDKNI
jgi:flagellar motor switch protein FliN